MNRGVNGRVVGEAGAGVANLLVGAYDVSRSTEGELLAHTGAADPLFPGFARTDPSGNFAIQYEETRPKLEVRVLSTVKRRIKAAGPFPDVDAPTFSLPSPIQVTAAEASGWAVTGPGSEPPVAGSDVEPIVDNEEAWAAVLEAVQGAAHSINYECFYLFVGGVFLTFDPALAPGGGAVKGGRLEDELAKAGERGVQVRIVNNYFTNPDMHACGGADTANLVKKFFAGKQNVEVRDFHTPLVAPVHAKLMVIDDTLAFSIGSPFVSDYYDASTHKIDDPRHGSYRGTLTEETQIRAPVHDVSLRIRGPAVKAVNETFRLHWNLVREGKPELAAAPAPPALPGGSGTQRTRTLFGNGRYPGLPDGETTIFESYLRAFELAQTFIYLENQYFCSREIADAIVLAVKQKPALRVIFVTNNKVDIPSYNKWHPETIRRVLQGLSEAERKRVGFFTTWSQEGSLEPSGKPRVLHNYIHSKVAIVDDVWATVGSANLDAVSLTTSDFVLRRPFTVSLLEGLAPRIGENRLESRGMEVSLSIFDGVAGQPPSSVPKQLRRRLWAEHLGFLSGGAPDPGASQLAAPPEPGDWLSLWEMRAGEKLAALNAAGAPGAHPARVLRIPHNAEEQPNKKIADSTFYLKQLNVDTSRLDVWEGFRRFSFATGDWETPPTLS